MELEEARIKGEILAASFYENWNFARELHKGKSSKAKAQFLEAEKVRKEWITHQNDIVNKKQ